MGPSGAEDLEERSYSARLGAGHGGQRLQHQHAYGIAGVGTHAKNPTSKPELKTRVAGESKNAASRAARAACAGPFTRGGCKGEHGGDESSSSYSASAVCERVGCRRVLAASYSLHPACSLRRASLARLAVCASVRLAAAHRPLTASKGCMYAILCARPNLQLPASEVRATLP
ncbi:hypothetical protein OBBRIDRAFT_835699 [Obba rivulosa]|uniref:Uncharacterized protein n=1 Tax=Obba rivulosa TaxID=1052685 RepID=A0A8E2DIS0_9APHY|nr:hypothetical protein OBBRIDRAFT_835699 [Obba rivulosa]